MNLENFLIVTKSQLFGFFSPDSRIFVFYLYTAFVLALVAYRQVETAHKAEALAAGEDYIKRQSFLAYVFNPTVWLHPSCILDMKYFVVNAAVYYGLILQFFVGTHVVSSGFYNLLVNLFSAPETALISGPLSIALYTVFSVLALDLGVYLMHYAFHKSPILWEFHKVHHSAEEMTPMTLFRMHPVDLWLTSVSIMYFQALAFGGFYFLTASTPQVASIFGLNVILFAFYLFGYNLRHSHIWLNFPVWLSKILISPAQHQIHHSIDPKHFDHNMGLIFSFWDRIFKTHYIPHEYEQLQYGLKRGESSPFQSVSDIYIKPFKKAASQIKNGFSTRKHRMSLGFSALVVAAVVFFSVQEPVGQPGMPSVKLADLTWTEVHAAIENGHRTVIIPTAGTEQNGPFVVLGKHNTVVGYTSQSIALKVGKALVAPIMDYVPEGDISPKPTGHMEYAGTISISEELFEGVLESTVRSLRVHGFNEFYFLGDSGGNQDSQNKVATLLTQEWAGQDVKVANLSAYYSENGQFSYLSNQGYSELDIGYHAGIRDTSEVLAIDPSSVRIIERNVLANRSTGHSGDPHKASARIGRSMLELKVEAAVEQIKSLRGL